MASIHRQAYEVPASAGRLTRVLKEAPAWGLGLISSMKVRDLKDHEVRET